MSTTPDDAFDWEFDVQFQTIGLDSVSSDSDSATGTLSTPREWPDDAFGLEFDVQFQTVSLEPTQAVDSDSATSSLSVEKTELASTATDTDSASGELFIGIVELSDTAVDTDSSSGEVFVGIAELSDTAIDPDSVVGSELKIAENTLFGKSLGSAEKRIVVKGDAHID